LQDPSVLLATAGFDVQVLPDPPGGHSVSVLGAYAEELAGEPVIVVYVDCCGEPLRVLVAQRGSRAAKAVRDINALQTVVWRGDVQLTVIGEHPAEAVLSLFQNV